MSERGAWHEWAVFFLRGVAEQAADAVRRAGELDDLQQAWRERLTRANAPARILGAIDLLFETQVLTIPGLAERIGVSYKTAQRYVETLEREGMVQQIEERGYGKTYYALEILRIVSLPAAPATAPMRQTEAD